MEKRILNNAAPVTLKILIVDDEIDICYLLSGILKQKNYRTTFVNTLSDAQLMLKKETPSLVFLDNHLPDGLGIDFIEHIKKNYPAIKIVMITANDGSIDRQKAFAGGVDYFLGKPFTKEMIFRIVDMLTTK